MSKTENPSAPLVSAEARLRIAEEDISYKSMRCAQLLDQLVAAHSRIAELEAQLAKPEDGDNG